MVPYMRHRKRELNFNNFAVGNAGVNAKDNNNSQPNELNDPGYTKQHDMDDLRKMLAEKNTNLTNSPNWLESLNPSGQMFHVIYMLPNPQKRELSSLQSPEVISRQQMNGGSENLANAGPHLFPAQFDEKSAQNKMQQFNNMPYKNFNNAFQNAYANPLLVPQYYQNMFKDSKVPTKMEAPFIPSQFLGYDQNQRQRLPPQPQQQKLLQHNQQQQQYVTQQHQQNQYLPPSNQLLTQQNHLLPQQNHLMSLPNSMLLTQQHQQQTLKTAPVYEHHEDLPFQSSNLIYMSPNNIYNLYRKPN